MVFFLLLQRVGLASVRVVLSKVVHEGVLGTRKRKRDGIGGEREMA